MAGWNTCNRCMQIRQRSPASPKAGWTAACNRSLSINISCVQHRQRSKHNSCTVMVSKHNSKCIKGQAELGQSSIVNFWYEHVKMDNSWCAKERIDTTHCTSQSKTFHLSSGWFVSLKQLHTLLSYSQSKALSACDGRLPGKLSPSEAKVSTCVIFKCDLAPTAV